MQNSKFAEELQSGSGKCTEGRVCQRDMYALRVCVCMRKIVVCYAINAVIMIKNETRQLCKPLSQSCIQCQFLHCHFHLPSKDDVQFIIKN